MADQDLGPLLRLSVEGLLGTRDFELELEVAGATILTGANGTGKSTILRAIDRFGRGAWPSMAQLPFTTMTFEFATGAPVLVHRESARRLQVRRGRRRWDYERTASTADYGWIVQHKLRENLLLIDPEMSDPGGVGSVVLPTIASSSTSQEYPSLIWGTTREPPDWLSAVVEEFNVLFVTDQRLVVEDKRPGGTRAQAETVRVAVTEYADDLRTRIASALVEYGQRAQALDRVFPENVVRAMRRRARRSTVQTALDLLRDVDAKSAVCRLLGSSQPTNPLPRRRIFAKTRCP